MLQGPLQALIRPAMWIPGIKNLHSHFVTWQSDKPPTEVLAALVRAIKQIKSADDTGSYYDIHKINKEKYFLRVFCFTRAEWLDVVEIEIKEDSIEAKSFSSGFLPLFIPFAFILNCVFFWVPFYDNKLNKARLELIKHYTDLAISEQKVNSLNDPPILQNSEQHNTNTQPHTPNFGEVDTPQDGAIMGNANESPYGGAEKEIPEIITDS
ncbi:unnamed protein product [Mytilus coruscus]|uniref:Uncharacterized protein n=1 Tax=Mytilus coruscus TaxID=42192 RepID=A0A6J8B8L3_MYTCO|nr:unnamed protein product [Mytilus coruscus]